MRYSEPLGYWGSTLAKKTSYISPKIPVTNNGALDHFAIGVALYYQNSSLNISQDSCYLQWSASETASARMMIILYLVQ